MKSEVWLLDTDYKNENVTIMSSGMTVLTSNKDKISVGYSQLDRLEKFRLISAAPELAEILNIIHIFLYWKMNKIVNQKVKF